MANTYVNSSIVLKSRLMLKAFYNQLVLGKLVSRDLEKVEWNRTGGTVSVRRPNMFKAVDGDDVTGLVQDINEAAVPFTIDKRKSVLVEISNKDATLSIDDAYESVIVPAMQELAQAVETDIANLYPEIGNYDKPASGTLDTFRKVGAARKRLRSLGVSYDLHGAFSPTVTLDLADELKNVFTQPAAEDALENALIKRMAGIKFYECQSIATHTSGLNTGTPLVNGSSQSVTYTASKTLWRQTLNLDGFTASQTPIIKRGDTFTIDDVWAVNRASRQKQPFLQTFSVLADANSNGSGQVTVTITPPMIIDGPYQTVTNAPADNAAVTILTGTSGRVTQQNMVMARDAIHLANVPIAGYDGVKTARTDYKGYSMRVSSQGDIYRGKNGHRVEIMYGLGVLNPDMASRLESIG